jgi:NAD(P)-dependent dehydrogenase (short-subunit alcohol dehydrogenase family)
VNAIAPGWFPTEMTHEVLSDEGGDVLLRSIPMARYGGEDDLKGAIVYLASDASSYVTGQTLAIDGGLLAS